MERYHQNALDPGEWLALDDHLTACEDCRHKLRVTVPARETLLALQAGTHAEPRSEEPGFWNRFLEFSGLAASRGGQSQERAGFKLTPRFAVMAAIILSLVAATGLWLRGREDKQNIAKTGPSSPASPQPSTNVSIDPAPNPSPELPPPILLALNDGDARVTFDAQGNLTGLESLPPSQQQRVKTALTTQKIETPEILKELEGASGAAMGSSSNEPFKLISPVGKIVAADRPTFRWQPLGDASSYRVTISDPKANYQEVAVSPALSNAEWRVVRPLRRGRVYAWQVTARTNGGDVKAPARDAPEARFGVLEHEQAIELARAKRDYAGRHLTLGLLYAQAGLLDDAEGEFQALAAANPKSTVAENLLRAIRVKRRVNTRLQPR